MVYIYLYSRSFNCQRLGNALAYSKTGSTRKNAKTKKTGVDYYTCA